VVPPRGLREAIHATAPAQSEETSGCSRPHYRSTHDDDQGPSGLGLTMYGLALLVIPLALLIWLFELAKAKITGKRPPWEERRAEQHPASPMVQAMMRSFDLPKRPSTDIRHDYQQVAAFYAAMACFCGVAAGCTYALTRSADTAIAAAIIGFAAFCMLGLLIAAVVEVRRTR
jgi:hypothetical protein